MVMAKKPSNKAQKLSTKELLCLPIDDVFARLNTPQNGLATRDADELLEIYGYNEVAKKESKADFIGFLLHFKNPLVLILLLAGVISGLFGKCNSRLFTGV